jgi:hypothetical protein
VELDKCPESRGRSNLAFLQKSESPHQVHLNRNPLDDVADDVTPASVIDPGDGWADVTGDVLHILWQQQRGGAVLQKAVCKEAASEPAESQPPSSSSVRIAQRALPALQPSSRRSWGARVKVN